MLLCNRKSVFTLTLVILCTVSQLQCKRFGSSSRGKSSWGGGWGSSNRGSRWGIGNKHSSSSRSNLDSKPHSSVSRPSAHSYPNSVGLSGSSVTGNIYPPSSGLSGSVTGNHGSGVYSSRSNLQSSNKHKYPVSPGLSGAKTMAASNENHGYPLSTSGMSGHSSAARKNYPAPSLSEQRLSHHETKDYPQSTGLSGNLKVNNNIYKNKFDRQPSSGLQSQMQPSHIPNVNGNLYNYYVNPHTSFSNTGSRLQPNYINKPHLSTYYTQPSYFASPQYVYVNEHRNSGSRFRDILTGLALYDFARSLNNHRHHYYHDDYYKNRYSQAPSKNENKFSESANCSLKIIENGTAEMLKLPCEIVSTFVHGSYNVSSQNISLNNSCNNDVLLSNETLYENTNKTSVLNNETTLPNLVNKLFQNNPTEKLLAKNKTLLASDYVNSKITTEINTSTSPTNGKDFGIDNSEILNATASKNFTEAVSFETLSNNNEIKNRTTLNDTEISSSNTLMIPKNGNANTLCNLTSMVDPLKIRGSSMDPVKKRCIVEIRTHNITHLNEIDCHILKEYSQIPESKKEALFMPSRSKLESWLANPPWWMSLFIAV